MVWEGHGGRACGEIGKGRKPVKRYSTKRKACVGGNREGCRKGETIALIKERKK